jgi:hypothetical protein
MPFSIATGTTTTGRSTPDDRRDFRGGGFDQRDGAAEVHARGEAVEEGLERGERATVAHAHDEQPPADVPDRHRDHAGEPTHDEVARRVEEIVGVRSRASSRLVA